MRGGPSALLLTCGGLLPARLLSMVLALLAAAPAARAQEGLLLSRSYAESDGLPSSTVFGIDQDAAGRLWILTRSGVARYDGLDWDVVDCGRVLPDETHFGLQVAPDGTLWTLGQGPTLEVAFLDGACWNTLPWPQEMGQPSSVHAFAVATGDSGPVVILAAGDNRLILFTGERWLRFDGEWSGGRINALMADHRRCWIAADSGLWVMHTDSLSIEPVPLSGAPHRAVLALASRRQRGEASSTRSGSLWLLGTTWLGVLHEDELRLVATDLEPLSGSFCRKAVLAVDDHGSVLWGNPARLQILERGAEEAYRLGGLHGLGNGGATSLLVDRENNIWIGSLRGLTKIGDRRFFSLARAQGLLEDEVSAIIEPSPGKLVFGHNHGISILEDGHVITRRIAADDVPGCRVMDLALDDRSRLWLACSGMGLMRLADGDTFVALGREHGLTGGLHAVAFDSQVGLVVGGTDGLFRLAGDRFEPVQLPVPEAPSVRRIVSGGDGCLYVATNGAGVFSLRDGCWRQASGPSSDANSVYTVLAWNDEVWVGTAAGLHRLAGDLLEPVIDAGPQVSRFVYALIGDPLGRLWLGTDNGLYYWNGVTLGHYTVHHGLAGNETNRAALLVDSQGRLWVGTDRGVSCYRHELEQPLVEPPLVELVGLDAQGQWFSLDDEVSLPPTSSTLTFHFRGVSFVNEERVQYRTRLQGFDREWSAAGTHAGAGLRYTSLPPGTYRFQVQARNDFSDWSPVVSSPPVAIAGPYWVQPWFLLLGVALLVSVAVALRYWIRSKRAAVLHDRLTGLPNRVFLVDLLRRLMDSGRQIVVLFVDLDRCKTVNSSLGHAAGDDLIRQAARRLQASVSEQTVVARAGGDEFVVVLEEVDDRAMAEQIARDIQACLGFPFALDGMEVFSTASVGIAMSSERYRDPEHLLRDAVAAIRNAKDQGSGAYAVFDPTMHERMVSLLRLEAELRRAVERGEFVLHYQPIIDRGTKNVVSLEALLRWDHPERGLLPPAQFIHTAETTGLILLIEDWGLQEACRQLARLRRTWSHLAVHVNIASHQFLRPFFVQRIERALAAEGLPPEGLSLEVTENAIMQRPELVIQVLNHVKRLGVGLCIDDFGTGHSSLSHVQSFPVDTLKIDRSFVHHLDDDAGSHIIAAVVSLGHKLGMSVVAEGVETADQLEVLQRLGCDRFQGYWFARPMPGDQLERLLLSPAGNLDV